MAKKAAAKPRAKTPRATSGTATETAAKPRKRTPRRTTTSSRVDGAHPRLKAYWAVCNQTLTIVSLYEYSERKKADKHAKDLTKSKNAPHFVQIVKRTIEE